MRLWLVLFLGALAIGLVCGSVAPERWSLAPADGLLLGSALYIAGWKRFVERRELTWREESTPPRGDTGAGAAAGANATAAAAAARTQGLIAGLALRAALFVLLVSIQATLCFDVLPNADVRRGFVVLSAWVVMLALIDTEPLRGAASRPS